MDVTDFLLPAFWPCYYPSVREARYQVYFGARGTGKSTNIGGIMQVLKIISDPKRNIVFVRKNDSDNSGSTIPQILRAISQLGLDFAFKKNEQRKTITYLPTGQQIVFRGFNNPTGLNSIAFPTGQLTDVVIEEASEITDFDDFAKLDGQVRGSWIGPDGTEWKPTISFLLNPWDIESWIAQKFCLPYLEEDEAYMETHAYQQIYAPSFKPTDGFGKGLYVHRTSYLANPFLDSDRKEMADEAKERAHAFYRTNYLGLWGNTQGMAYAEWKPSEHVKTLSDLLTGGMFRPYWFALGVDTGLSDGNGKFRGVGRDKSATAVELVAMDLQCENIAVLDEWYWSNEGKGPGQVKTSLQEYSEIARWIADKAKEFQNVPFLMKGRISVYVDSADIGGRDSIEAFCRQQGMPNAAVMGSGKKGGINARVAFTKLMMGTGHLFVSDRCQNLQREISLCKVGKNGMMRDGIGDHAINAFEYAWYPFRNKIRRWEAFSK